MTVIRIREQGRTSDGAFDVLVAFDEYAEYSVQINNITDASTEGLLTWYFEEHLQFPFLDKDQEKLAVKHLAEYGQELFTQVLGGEANHDYRSLREQGFDGCRFEVVGSSAFHSLHWEALRDPEIESPLSVRFPVTRRVERLPSKFKLPHGQPTLNILVVTARPFGRNDVGYRTISRPLLSAMRQSTIPVTIDLVRPGTWEALRDHLQAQNDRHQSGWYHVIHFDLHGAFSDYAALDNQRVSNQLTFSNISVKPFEGKQPFLFFETAQEEKAAAIPATAVASLLNEHRIPIAVLNACQSATQSDSEASLAQHLAQAGVPVAIGMAYSVTVSAAALAMPCFYSQLSQGVDPIAALHTARRRLYETPERQAYFDQQIDLQDWALPVAFRQQSVQIQLKPMNNEQQSHFYQREATVGDEPVPEYGFVGRDIDIQAIERQLLTSSNNNEILVRGMAGSGKSTLLHHLAWWWQRTSLIEEVFEFSYEDRAWTCSQIIHEIRGRLLSNSEQACSNTMPESAQMEQIAQLLRGHRHLLILDNAESITATPAAIPHALDSAEQAHIKTFLSRLKGGKTLVLIGSRENESWLGYQSFGDNIYQLPGLDPQANSVLLDRILRRHNATHWLNDETERPVLQRLVSLLGGYPLPMTVVLPTLAEVSPSTVVSDLKSGDVSPDPAGQIICAIEYSHGKLDPGLQDALLLLAPFTAVIPIGPMLDKYVSFLQEHEVVRAMGPIDLAKAVDETTRVGLATSLAQHMARVQPVLPYFLRSRLRQREALWIAANQAHYKFCCDLGLAIHVLLTSPGDPDKRANGQTNANLMYAEMSAALTYGLKTSQPIMSLIYSLDEYLDQTRHANARRRLLDETIADYPEPLNEEQRRNLAVLHNFAGNTAFKQHRLEDAKKHHETELELYKTVKDDEGIGATYGMLGNVAQSQRHLDVAQDNYREALKVFLRSNNEHSAAGIYHALGNIDVDQESYQNANNNYRKSLELFLKLNDEYSSAVVHHSLGNLAREQKRFRAAERSYRRTLEICLKFDDQHTAAMAYYGLGLVAREQKQYTEAERNYRHALEVYLKLGDRHSVANIYNALGILAVDQDRNEEAETNLNRARDIYLEFNNEHSSATNYYMLGRLTAKQKRFVEAKRNYRKALGTFLRLGERYLAIDTYVGLGDLASEQEQLEEAIQYYRQALNISLKLNHETSTASIHLALGNFYAKQERFGEAEENYRKSLDIFLRIREQQNAVYAYNGLGNIASLQGRSAEAVDFYRKSLEILRGLDRQTASQMAGSIGSSLAKLGRHEEAIELLLESAISWYYLMKVWAPIDLEWLKRERREVDDITFKTLIQKFVPGNLRQPLTAAIENFDGS